jgi:RNA polymerase sigma-70 factor (ECF subfamily)
MDAGTGFGAEQVKKADSPRSESSVVRCAVRAVREGDREAFRPLIDLYGKRIFGLALTIVRDPSGAEEVTQDAFVGAYMHIDRYDAGRPFFPWLVAIAVRHAQTWLRRHRSRTGREGAAPDLGANVPASGKDPLDTLITDERGRSLWRRVAALPSGQRTVVTLYYGQEMKVNAIARAMGITGGTVKTLLFRARQSLRRSLGEDMCAFLTGYGKET